MKKLLLTLMLAVVSSSTMAEWIGIAKNDNFIIYADPTTIRKSGNIVKMWSLSDYNAPQYIEQVMSAMVQREYDCKEEKSRQLYMAYYTKNMGNGDIIFINAEPRNWLAFPPRTAGAQTLEFACGQEDKI